MVVCPGKLCVSLPDTKIDSADAAAMGEVGGETSTDGRGASDGGGGGGDEAGWGGAETGEADWGDSWRTAPFRFFCVLDREGAPKELRACAAFWLLVGLSCRTRILVNTIQIERMNARKAKRMTHHRGRRNDLGTLPCTLSCTQEPACVCCV